MARWKEGRYSTSYLLLGSGLQATVNWTTQKNDPKPWHVTVFGEKVGSEKELDAAKKLAEAEAEKRLLNALEKLAGAAPEERTR